MNTAPPKPRRIYEVQPFKGEDGRDYVHAIASNGERLFVTEAYDSAANATRSALALCGAQLVFKPRAKTRSAK